MFGWWFRSSAGLNAAGNVAKTVGSLLAAGLAAAIVTKKSGLTTVLIAASIVAGTVVIALTLAEGHARKREALAAGDEPSIPRMSRRRLASIVALMSLVLAGSIWVATRLSGDGETLKLRSIEVVNGEAHFAGPESDLLMSGRQLRGSLPRLLLSVYNAGEHRAVMSSARFEVLEAAPLGWCGDGLGELEVEQTYDVLLPQALPPVPPARLTGKAVSIPLPRDLAPDRAERFGFTFGNDRGFPTVYRLRGSIRYDDGQSLSLGDFVLFVPGVPSGEGGWALRAPDPEVLRFYLRSLPDLPEAGRFVERRYSDCLRANLRAVRSVVDLDDAHSPQIERVAGFELSPSFRRLSSPAKRPLQLIEDGEYEQAVAFAEDELGDTALARRYRELVAARQLATAREMLGWGRESLRGDYPEVGYAHGCVLTAIRRAEASLSFHETAAAREVLAEARAEDRALPVKFDWGTAFPRL